tara:strand:+ start:296 stop:541 length:246 start_codon:yes stop_codon:yes gene_type:complete
MQEEKMKKTKYMKKGGVLKRKGGGKATKYAAKGGALKRMGGGMAKKTKYMSKGGAMKKTKYMSKGGMLAGMTARRNARRGK